LKKKIFKKKIFKFILDHSLAENSFSFFAAS